MHSTPHHDTHSIQRQREWRVWLAVAFNVVIMILEIGAGYKTHSMALLADGWHMATHVGALGLSGFAYWAVRRWEHDHRLPNGTGKLLPLAGYTNAIVLGLVGVATIWASIQELAHPEPIRYKTAIIVAVIGAVINLLTAGILHGATHRGHHHGDHDHNMESAYLHVLADTLTSGLAIAALVLGKWMSWTVLDPIFGILGGAIILRWSLQLGKSSVLHLLDAVTHR